MGTMRIIEIAVTETTTQPWLSAQKSTASRFLESR